MPTSHGHLLLACDHRWFWNNQPGRADRGGQQQSGRGRQLLETWDPAPEWPNTCFCSLGV